MEISHILIEEIVAILSLAVILLILGVIQLLRNPAPLILPFEEVFEEEKEDSKSKSIDRRIRLWKIMNILLKYDRIKYENGRQGRITKFLKKPYIYFEYALIRLGFESRCWNQKTIGKLLDIPKSTTSKDCKYLEKRKLIEQAEVQVRKIKRKELYLTEKGLDLLRSKRLFSFLIPNNRAELVWMILNSTSWLVGWIILISPFLAMLFRKIGLYHADSILVTTFIISLVVLLITLAIEKLYKELFILRRKRRK